MQLERKTLPTRLEMQRCVDRKVVRCARLDAFVEVEEPDIEAPRRVLAQNDDVFSVLVEHNELIAAKIDLNAVSGDFCVTYASESAR